MTKKLFVSAITKFTAGVVLIGALIFAPAGTLRYPQGWLFMTTAFLFLSMQLVLGYPIPFVIFLAYPLIIAKRIKGKEQLLEKELEGYKEYKNKVEYKMIPFVW